MQTALDCIPCFIRQALDALRGICEDEEMIRRSMQRVLRATADFDLRLSPPHMAQYIHRIIREEMGDEDPYREIKKRSTRFALSHVDDVEHLIQGANNSFECAIRFSIAGNILDFALLSAWNDQNIQQSFAKAVRHPVDGAMIAQLQDEIKQASTVLILGDNAGETVFDRIMIDHLPGKAKIIYAVKDSPVINDATMEDAEEAGINQVAELITNGTDAPGTLLEQCSESFLEIYNEADVVIAKGQANFETLNDVERKVYFLTQIKCPVIALHNGYSVGDWLVTNTFALREIQKERKSNEDCCCLG